MSFNFYHTINGEIMRIILLLIVPFNLYAATIFDPENIRALSKIFFTPTTFEQAYQIGDYTVSNNYRCYYQHSEVNCVGSYNMTSEIIDIKNRQVSIKYSGPGGSKVVVSDLSDFNYNGFEYYYSWATADSSDNEYHYSNGKMTTVKIDGVELPSFQFTLKIINPNIKENNIILNVVYNLLDSKQMHLGQEHKLQLLGATTQKLWSQIVELSRVE